MEKITDNRIKPKSIDDLPTEIFWKILNYLDYKNRGILARVNKNMYKSLNNPGYLYLYWSELYQSNIFKFKKLPSGLHSDNYCEIYEDALLYKKRCMNFTEKQHQLFAEIRLRGNLDALKQEQWDPEKDFETTYDSNGKNAIELARLYKREDILKYFHEKIAETFSDNQKKEIYSIVTCNDYSKKHLLNESTLNQPLRNGATPFYLAAENGSLEIVQFLIEAGADPVKDIVINIKPSLNHIKSPLRIAVENGHDEVVKFLVAKKFGVDCFPRLINLATEKGHLNVIKVLLKAGAPLDITNGDIRQANLLHIAATNGYADVVQFLIENGADVNQISNYGYPLQLAAKKAHHEVVKILIDASGAKIKYQHFSDNNYNHLNNHNINPLCVTYNVKIAKMLIAAGINVNHTYRHPFKCTPLHSSVYSNTKMVNFLIKAGANIESIDADGQTALFIASKEGKLEAVQALVKAGASINCVNKNGVTPLSVAKEYSKDDVFAFLNLCQVKEKYENEPLPLKIIALLRTNIDPKINTFNFLGGFFFDQADKTLIQKLKSLHKLNIKIDTEQVALILERHKTVIPERIYSFVMGYVLHTENKANPKSHEAPAKCFT